MIAYASMTQGSRNLAALRRYGWRVLVSPAHKSSTTWCQADTP